MTYTELLKVKYWKEHLETFKTGVKCHNWCDGDTAKPYIITYVSGSKGLFVLCDECFKKHPSWPFNNDNNIGSIKIRELTTKELFCYSINT